LIRQPQETILVLISDLYEGGNNNELRKRVGSIVASGVQVVALLALNDDGAPCFDKSNAAAFATLGSPAFACTPEQFSDILAATLSRQDIGLWAAKAGLATTRGN
jgi:hypothetical protein